MTLVTAVIAGCVLLVLFGNFLTALAAVSDIMTHFSSTISFDIFQAA